MGKRKLAVVLSGGGAKGAYEAGALSTIVKHVKRIDVLTGASIGAINAALFAWEYEKNGDMVKAAEIVKDMWYELDKLFRISSWRLLKEMLLSFVKTCSPFNFASLVDNSIIKDRLNSLFPEDLKISDITNLELVINATSLTAGKAVSFNRDSGVTIIEALLASSAIPLLFPAQILEGSYYVDGGLFNNTPLRDAINARATDIIVVELKPPTSEIYWDTIGDSTRYDSIYNTGSRLMEVILDKIMYEDLQNAKKINNIIDVIMALEKANGDPLILEKLKKSIGYEKDGRVKRHVNFYEIAPLVRLVPPGTLGFENKEAI